MRPKNLPDVLVISDSDPCFDYKFINISYKINKYVKIKRPIFCFLNGLQWSKETFYFWTLNLKLIIYNKSSTSGSSDNSSEDSMECLSEGSIDEKSVEADKFASLTHWSDKVLREAARSHFQIFPLAEINDAIEAMVWWESALKSRNQRLDEENAEYGAKLHEVRC